MHHFITYFSLNYLIEKQKIEIKRRNKTMNESHLSKGAALFSRTHKFVFMYQSSLFRRKR